jgi:hypothetical protein
MATPMNSTQFRVIVEPILNEHFDGVYDQRKDEYKTVFRVKPGIKRAYHEEPVLFGLGAAPQMGDGGPVTYKSGGVLFDKRYVFRQYGAAFALTKVLVEDGDHINLGKIYSEQLGQAMVETEELAAANVLNFAFNGAYLGGDGQPLNSASHPILGGVQSNLLTTPAAMSQTSVESMLIQIRKAQDNDTKKVRITPKRLIVSPDNEFQAEVITKSALRTGQANNDINPILSTKILPQGYEVITRLTSATAWWVHTDERMGLQFITRRMAEKSMEGDFETDSMRYKVTSRWDCGWTNFRTVWGTPGA